MLATRTRKARWVPLTSLHFEHHLPWFATWHQLTVTSLPRSLSALVSHSAFSNFGNVIAIRLHPHPTLRACWSPYRLKSHKRSSITHQSPSYACCERDRHLICKSSRFDSSHHAPDPLLCSQFDESGPFAHPLKASASPSSRAPSPGARVVAPNSRRSRHSPRRHVASSE